MSSLRTSASLDDFVADPCGARLRGPHFCYFAPHASLAVGVAAGRLDADDVRALVALMEARRAAPLHRVVWDTSRVEEFVQDAFVSLEKYFVRHFRDEISIERVAVVPPQSGTLRAAGAGIFAFLEPPFAAAAFPTLDAALAWLGAPCAGVPEMIEQEATALVASAFDDVVAAWLDAHLASATVEQCARDLAVSVRTLQRRLAERKTTFEAEANAARVRAAERRLPTGASLTEIAYEAGFSSPQRFASVFRKLKGESPSAVRARLKMAPDGK